MAAKEVDDKMALSEVATEKVLPMEIWHEIWSSLDFNTLQKICVLVSKTWKFEIRNQPKFSNEVKIKTMDHGNLLRGIDICFSQFITETKWSKFANIVGKNCDSFFKLK